MSLQEVVFQSRKYVIALLCALMLWCVEGVFGVDTVRWPLESLLRTVSPLQSLIATRVHAVHSSITQWADAPMRIATLEAERAMQESQLQLYRLERDTAVQLCTAQQRLEIDLPSPRLTVVGQLLSGGERWGVDRGAVDGIERGDLVFASGVLIGHVDHVFSHSSTLSTLLHGQWGVVVQNPAGTQGVIALSHTNRSLVLDHIAAEKELAVGDRLYTSGVAGTVMIPRGIYVGSIKNINEQHAQLSRTAGIDQGISLTDIGVVTIQRW